MPKFGIALALIRSQKSQKTRFSNEKISKQFEEALTRCSGVFMEKF
jgi:hypothetical protein